MLFAEHVVGVGAKKKKMPPAGLEPATTRLGRGDSRL